MALIGGTMALIGVKMALIGVNQRRNGGQSPFSRRLNGVIKWR
jgi:hypothetical protein